MKTRLWGKTALALVLALAMLASMTVCGLAETLTGEAEGYKGPVTDEVTVEDGKIVDLKLTGEKETPEIGGIAMDVLQQAIIDAGTIEGVDGVTGATLTSGRIMKAVAECLTQAAE